MNGFHPGQLPQQEEHATLALGRQQNGPPRTRSVPMALPASVPETAAFGLGSSEIMGGDSLSDIVLLDDMDMYPRQGVSPGHTNQKVNRGPEMMEFGSNTDNLHAFQFRAPKPGPSNAHLIPGSASMVEICGGGIGISPDIDLLNDQLMAFRCSFQDPGLLGIPPVALGVPPISAGTAPGISEYPIVIDDISEENIALHTFPSPNFSQLFGDSSLGTMSNGIVMPTSGVTEILQPDSTAPDNSDCTGVVARTPVLPSTDSAMTASPMKMSISPKIVAYGSPPSLNTIPPLSPQDAFGLVESKQSASTGTQIIPLLKTRSEPKYPRTYSSRSFNVSKILAKVSTRANPEIDIGKIDMSCAFVVCNATVGDCPIIYVSDSFERLTGYNQQEIVGQNCRFLQSPRGSVQAGDRRKFVDNDSVYYLKRRILEKREAQRSMINYRKGGQPFINLLTMIPVSNGENDELKYYVGFQVDLVETPTSMHRNSACGLYSVDYSLDTLPRYVWSPPQTQVDDDQAISRDDISAALSYIDKMEPELTKQVWDKLMLENSGDVMHVLSPQGLFLYLSPSCKHILEYDPLKLVGTALSSICHPSDIIPVTRELQSAPIGAQVNTVFRIRRRKSGYIWFDSHGSVCTEQGKNQKYIILVGRTRPIYTLGQSGIEATGGIMESEIWTKLSTSGMFLFVSSSVRTLLDRLPDDMIGTSMQALMRPESKVAFDRALEKVKTGKRITHIHEILNKRGFTLQAQTTLYPGDTLDGQRPTFFIAQIRLPKAPLRAMAPRGSQGTPNLRLAKTQPEELTPPNYSQGPSSPKLAQGPLTSFLRRSTPGTTTRTNDQNLATVAQYEGQESEETIFAELKVTRCTSWQFELGQMEKSNRALAEELAILLSNKKKRKRRKGGRPVEKECTNCHTIATPEWRRGPSGHRDLCNSCGLRWAKQTGRVTPRNAQRDSSSAFSKAHPQHSAFPVPSPLQQAVGLAGSMDSAPNLNPSSKRELD